MTLKSNVNILDHQRRVMDLSAKSKYIINASSMGAGKSLAALAGALETSSNFTLVVCPAFLKANWLEEYEKFTEGLIVTVINNQKDLPAALISDVAIINYARLSVAGSLIAQADFIIADEAHYLKNIEAQRTNVFHKYIQMYKPKSLVLLTGTPIKNRVYEFYSLLKLMSYGEYDNGKDISEKFKSENQFAKYFSHEEIIQFKVWSPAFKKQILVRQSQFSGLKNKEELRSYLSGKYFRVKTADVVDLPELNQRFMRVDGKSKGAALAKAFDVYSRQDKENIPEALMTLKRKAAVSKAKFTADIAKNAHESDGKQVVIFSDHIEPVEIIAKSLNVPFIVGSTPLKKRDSIVKRFASGDLKYFVATIGAASTGLNLVAATLLIFNDVSYVPSDNEQAKCRIYRIGQEKDCQIITITANIMDEKIIKSLQEKQETINKII